MLVAMSAESIESNYPMPRQGMPEDSWIALSSKSKAGAQPEQIDGY